ncbi:cell wall-active antibiotics response protein LiaF [Vagococcus entomophilus]|uniref:Uncharacterized protein n=1 Tax=Vagococcus entomophilus TaxID=1160095 RepID=A0A430AEL1_9ENTE|nr:cell wall-active antibiotics response protein LiaF [Vagococcus entomophilus]RSU05895.1 hypothetical protein CBF30_11315 [Vagococcus entomophilus]
MKNSWKLFLIIELALLLLFLWQIFHEPNVLFCTVVLGFISSMEVKKKKRRGAFHQFIFVSSILLLIFCLFSIPATWLFLTVTLLFIVLKGAELSGSLFGTQNIWMKKGIHIIQTEEPSEKSGKRAKHNWFGNQHIGDHVYEWDDLNFFIFAGDTIIDLGNTLLPKTDNVIMMRKGFGRTRILVPQGIAISVIGSSLNGKLTFEGQTYSLFNETMNVYSEDYDTNDRRIKIVSSTLLGDIEVIRT